ncbi:hypothetical protein BU16DRAFT_539755 [Lophium mytilinum]|uniref:Uncharacterized protein n=1 Tax=Lophium mytilinum TaxID=390894 RepID=A0A6A6QQ09_9PEZI|nr:hypothetical protein BU16DRAFT_539755 [Lophium mytilinum]
MNPPKSRLRLTNAKITNPVTSIQTPSSLSYSAAVTRSLTSTADAESLTGPQRTQDNDRSFPTVSEAHLVPRNSDHGSHGVSESLPSPLSPPITMPANVQSMLNQSLSARSRPGKAARIKARTRELQKLSSWTHKATSSQQPSLHPSSYDQATPKFIRCIEDAAVEAAVSGILLSTDPSAWDLSEIETHGSRIEDFDVGMVINFIMMTICANGGLMAGDPGVILTQQGLKLFKHRFGLIVQKQGNTMDVVPMYTHRGQGISHLEPSTWSRYASLGVKGKAIDADRYAPGPRLLFDDDLSFKLKDNSYARVSQLYTIDFGRKTPLLCNEEIMGRLTDESFAELKRRCGV